MSDDEFKALVSRVIAGAVGDGESAARTLVGHAWDLRNVVREQTEAGCICMTCEKGRSLLKAKGGGK